MKKHIAAVLLVLVMCLAALSGCSALKALEKDLRLVLKAGDEIHAIYDISIYNNAVIDEPEAPEGKRFYGWSPQENWEEIAQEEVVVTPKTTFIAYNDVKEYVANGSTSLTLYATFYEIPPKDLVVAWYRAEGVSTQTGLTQEIMDGFTQDMYAFLETKDYTPADMDIVVRAYDGNVGNSCGALLSDGDVDLMVGWGSNITSTGGVNPVENIANVQVGTVSRYAARLNDKYLSRLVFVWILNTYGGQSLEYPLPGEITDPEPPVVDPEPPVTQSGIQYTIGEEDVLTLKIGCYGFLKTSGFTNEIKDKFEEGLKAALKQCGATDEQLAGVEVKFYCYSESTGSADETNNVAALDGAIEADGGVDILLGGRTFTASNGPYCRPLIKESSDDMTIGTSNNRKVIRFSNRGLVLAVYNWLATPEALALLATPDAA